MAFQLIVEDGTGLASANALISLGFAKDYFDSHGYAYSSYTDQQIGQSIVRASQYLSESFTWKGHRTRPRNYTGDGGQALAWPREGVVDGDGIPVPGHVIPRGVQWATAEIAYYELVNPGAFYPVHDANKVVQSEKVGPLAVTYDTSRSSQWNARPEMPVVLDLIGEYLAIGSQNSLFGEVVRV